MKRHLQQKASRKPMPHQRARTILSTLQKRLRLWPALGVIGPRQCGKSTLLREILSSKVDTTYLTMDSESARKRAERMPESFTEPESGKIKIIDEIQKVPKLFDSVKLHIDQKRRPGTYILSGSTEFSQLLGIRESLTGRIAILNLYPFTLSEIHDQNFSNYFLQSRKCRTLISSAEFDKKLQTGGMPGFFFLHSKDEFSHAAQAWIETTCFRDLGRVLKKNFDGELALAILTTLAQTDVPDAGEVARQLERDTRVVKRYLDAFATILVVKKVAPHAVGIGKDHYIIVDSGIATYLGASREQSIRSHVLIEALSLFEAQGLARPQVEYYRSEKSSYVPLIFSWKNEKKTVSVQISDRETPTTGEIQSLFSLKKRLKNPDRSLLLSMISESYVEDKIEHFPLRG
jgi:predicted AAA+ superfamily ATPase